MHDAENTQTDNSAGTEQQSNAGEKKFSQHELDAIVQERLDRQKKALAAQQQKLKDDADQATLAEQQRYKDLADVYKQQVAELEPLATKVERYEAVITARLDNERKGLPKAIVALLDKMDVADQLEWIETNKAEIAKPAAVDINATNRGTAPNKHDRIAAAVEDLRRSGHYSPF